MREFDAEGLALCRVQGGLFERSRDACSCSSAVFVRRFMLSEVAARIDTGDFLSESITDEGVFQELREQYGSSAYGSLRYGAEELYWMGYLYRYWAYCYEMRSARIYRLVGAREMRGLYAPYHTLDPNQAIRRIAEAKGIALEQGDSIERGVRLLRKIRSSQLLL